MSQLPKKQPVIRKLPKRRVVPQEVQDYNDEEAYDYEDPPEYAPDYEQPRARTRSDYYGPGVQSTRRSGRRSAPPPPPRRDLFPFVMGSVIGALVVGLMVLVYIFATSSRPGSVAAPNSAPPSGGSSSQPTQPAAAGQTPPRMPLAEFKALYDDPAKRPLIVDVRAKQYYDQGHIKGAVSIPEAEIDARLNEIPKDRLVVAYCQ